MKAVYGQSEYKHFVVVMTPYFGYEVVFSGSIDECDHFVKSKYTDKLDTVLTKTDVNDDLSIIIVSATFINAVHTYNTKHLSE